jgi:DNA primase large subunit
MVPISQLQLARKYPFSLHAKSVVKQLVPDLTRIEPASFEAALAMVDACSVTSPKARRKFVENHFSKRDLSYAEFLQNDVLAFPLAKIILSQLKHPLLFERFAQLMGDLTFDYLNAEKDKVGIFSDIARDLNAPVHVSLDDVPVVSLSLPVYLSIPFRDAQLHLVHQPLEKGVVKLEWNLACRWMAERVHAHVLQSLPVDTQGLPPLFSEIQKAAQSRLQEVRAHEAKLTISSGLVLEAFPPCMDKLYSDITSGVNIPHMARFDLATFLVNVHMPFEDIISVFAKASNYDEKITRYHVGNLAGKNGKTYSSPACAKIREHGLCISRTCNVTHPLQFYQRELTTPTVKEKKEDEKIVESKSAE